MTMTKISIFGIFNIYLSKTFQTYLEHCTNSSHMSNIHLGLMLTCSLSMNLIFRDIHRVPQKSCYTFYFRSFWLKLNIVEHFVHFNNCQILVTKSRQVPPNEN